MTDFTNLINEVSEGLHSPVTDTDIAIVVNEDTRDFTLPDGFNPIVGVVGDCNSEIVTFEVPKHIETHNVMECSEIKVFWKNESAGSDGEFEVTDIREKDESTVRFGWRIDENVAAHEGELTFALQFTDYDADGQVLYRWKTIDGTGIRIEGTQFGESVNETIQKSFVKLVDQTTGEKYKLYISKGKLYMEED